MGVVYEAHDPDLGREVALKVVELAFAVPEDERRVFEQRFQAEARTAARLSHPGLVPVYDVGRDPDSGALFMAMELLRGRTLDSVLKERGAFEWREALRIAQRVAEALHHAHTQGVVHRDVKPANIMLLSSGEPKVMDFGIARLETSQLTATGQFLGTPLYMSPEQALAHPVDARSDIFSLGSVLYEMLTGRRAFDGETVTKILFQVIGREPDPVLTVMPGLPQAVGYLLTRCLAKDPAQRYPDARALAADIEDILADRPPRGRPAWQPAPDATGTLAVGQFTPPPPAPTAVPAGARSGPPRAVVAGVAALLVACLAGGLLLLRKEPPARRLEQPTPTTQAAPAAANDEDSGAPARLNVELEHSLRSGTFRVWVDDHLVVDEVVGGQVTRDIGGIKFRKGRLSVPLEVAAGRREVRVQVSWDDNVKTETTVGRFKPGSVRLLRAKLGSLGGLRKDLSLDWE
jgi:serine/threonine-protein kinase